MSDLHEEAFEMFEIDEKAQTDMLYKLKALLNLKDEINVATKLKDELDAQFYELEAECFSLMQQAQVSNITIDGRNLYQKINRFSQVLDKPNLHDWLRENGYADLLVENVNSATLSAVMRELEDEGGDIPDSIKIVRKNKVGIRKASKK
ncbi:MAG: hypothetical protein KJN62_02535 [Deltaproteobacteria bacterium]|nr:hypothetical protein [Deltaproteobacteria bacterium]